jgi:hypothetical protein
LAGLSVSVVNFWSKSNANLDGTLFPAFVRISGFLTTQELRNVTRIAVFFDNVFVLNYVSWFRFLKPKIIMVKPK